MITLIQFAGLAAIICSTFVITSKNPVLSVLFLICVFLSIALWLVLHGTTYLGLAYIIIYVGAIAILFLFVIMMLNIKVSDLVYTGLELQNNLPLGSLLILLFGLVVGAEFLSFVPSGPVSTLFDSVASNNINVHELSFVTYGSDTTLNNFMQIESIGMGLYTNLIVWLVAVSFILMLAMVGPILLCMNQESEDIDRGNLQD